MALGGDAVVVGVPFLASPNCDERPAGVAISLLVIHAISLPPGRFGGDSIERLFTNRLNPESDPYFREVHDLRVSAHFLVRRDGELIQFVALGRRAWHAGASCWRGRERCNDFSVGVELEGCDDRPFQVAQYHRLASLTRLLQTKLPLTDIAAHSDIAPTRKTDPGPLFDWPRYYSLLLGA